MKAEQFHNEKGGARRPKALLATYLGQHKIVAIVTDKSVKMSSAVFDNLAQQVLLYLLRRMGVDPLALKER